MGGFADRKGRGGKWWPWAVIVVGIAAVYWNAHHVTYVSGALPQQAYVATEAWSAAANRDAIASRGTALDELLFAAGDVSIPVELSLPQVNLPFLASHHVRTGLVLLVTSGTQIGGPHSSTRPVDNIAQQIVSTAQKGGVDLRELQIDYTNAAEISQNLEDEISQIKASIGPQCPLTIVAPVDWINNSQFVRAAKLAGGFVLKLRPGLGTQQIELDVKQAALCGVPFRIALPTYSTHAQPPLHADPKMTADLINAWRNEHPANMTAILWDYLGSDDESLNWRWVTLKSVMNGITPQPDVKLELRRPEKNLTEIDLVNNGDGDASSAGDVSVLWSDADLEDAQALEGYQREETGRQSETLHARDSLRDNPLRPGERRAIGWVRLTDDSPIRAQFAAEFSAASPPAN